VADLEVAVDDAVDLEIVVAVAERVHQLFSDLPQQPTTHAPLDFTTPQQT